MERAYAEGWRPLREILDRLDAGFAFQGLDPVRTFRLWRSRRVIPTSVRAPLRGWREGQRVVLWPPELEQCLRDALRLRPSTQMRGQLHGRGRKAGPSHSALRLLLWVYRWEYGVDPIKRDILHIVSQFQTLTYSHDSLKLTELARWLFSGTRGLTQARLAKQESEFRQTARLRTIDSQSVRALKAFMQWLNALASEGIHPAAKGKDSFWTGEQGYTYESLKAAIQSLPSLHELEVIRARWGKILQELFPQTASSGNELKSLFAVDSSESGLSWLVLQQLDKGRYRMTTPHEAEDWNAKWEELKRGKPELRFLEPGRIFFYDGSAYDRFTNQRVAVLVPSYRPRNFRSALVRLARYLGVFLALQTMGSLTSRKGAQLEVKASVVSA